MGFISKVKKVFKTWSWRNLFYNIYYLSQKKLNDREDDLLYKAKDEALEEFIYEAKTAEDKLVRLDVLDGPQTLKKLAEEPKSFTRFGDGEIQIIEGKDQPFQKYDPVLAEKMLNILQENRKDLYVGLNYAYFESPWNYTERNRRFYRLHGTHFRRFFTSLCPIERQYLDAACFGAYFRYSEEFDFEKHYDTIKNLFKDKDITIICGEGILDKLEYDVFDRAKSKQIISAPRLNAFTEYNRILAEVQEKADKHHIICLILGMTATAMVADLTDLGYVAWDIGHIAKDYNSYMTKEAKTKENMDKFWAPD